MADGLARTLDEMARRGVDALMLGREGNARYVSGANRLWLAGTRPFAPGCVVVHETEAVHLLSVTDVGVPPEIPRDHLYPLSWNPMAIAQTVAGFPGIGSARRIGVDGMTPLFEQLLAATLPGVELVDGEALMRSVRAVKTDREVAAIRDAVAPAEHALRAAINALRPGVRERELLGVFEEEMARRGTTTPAYEGAFCVVDGDDVRPFVTDRAVEDGDIVVMDAGVMLAGWEGSLARTWACGEPSSRARQAFTQWREQWSALVEPAGPGTRVASLRAVEGAGIDGLGLGDEGLADDGVLEPDMVVSVRLAAHGIVGRDVQLVTADGLEPLTTFPAGPLAQRA